MLVDFTSLPAQYSTPVPINRVSGPQTRPAQGPRTLPSMALPVLVRVLTPEACQGHYQSANSREARGLRREAREIEEEVFPWWEEMEMETLYYKCL